MSRPPSPNGANGRGAAGANSRVRVVVREAQNQTEGEGVMPSRLLTHLQRQRKLMPSEQERRESPSRRGYGRRWQRLRMMVLRRDPICVVAGCIEPSTDADHIIPKSQGGDDSMENLQGMCHSHHSRKTRLEGRAGRISGG